MSAVCLEFRFYTTYSYILLHKNVLRGTKFPLELWKSIKLTEWLTDRMYCTYVRTYLLIAMDMKQQVDSRL